MFKRLALVAGSIAAVVLVRKKAKQQQAEQDLWTQATDDVQAPAPADTSFSPDDAPANQI
ncbi:hypothetical protein BA895_11265 [Humibacillus sp. DSM 29435]|uniref:DLW-39 family protein n=1 Tax=Humibacillus sp. DSM 29435 TaxID=1869167 RepID=UPI000872EBBC|nr:DLW-39 family protein [Humibacillus sp. DSM 29435]OFE14197.1 hypothetical protein BA895_11265 [Humibacillus sp. DSM 29435]